MALFINLGCQPSYLPRSAYGLPLSARPAAGVSPEFLCLELKKSENQD